MGAAASAPPPPPPPQQRKWISARVEGRRHLVVEFNGVVARTAQEGMANAWADDEARALEMQALTPGVPSHPDGNEGPNARGTFSKAYVMRHPEIEWVHRGQGRYLPATQARSIASAAVVEYVCPSVLLSRRMDRGLLLTVA